LPLGPDALAWRIHHKEWGGLYEVQGRAGYDLSRKTLERLTNGSPLLHIVGEATRFEAAVTKVVQAPTSHLESKAKERRRGKKRREKWKEERKAISLSKVWGHVIR
jgi:hypothetical protein